MARTLGTNPTRRMVGAGLNAGKRTANPRGMNQKSKQTIYQDPRWRRARKLVLSHYPTCCAPGCVAKAAVVDHIHPIQQPALPMGGVGHAFDIRNLQPVCRDHHARKNADIDAPGGDVSRYRFDRTDQADMRPDGMKEWAEFIYTSGQQMKLIGTPAGGKGTTARREWVGDVCC